MNRIKWLSGNSEDKNHSQHCISWCVWSLISGDMVSNSIDICLSEYLSKVNFFLSLKISQLLQYQQWWHLFLSKSDFSWRLDPCSFFLLRMFTLLCHSLTAMAHNLWKFFIKIHNDINFDDDIKPKRDFIASTPLCFLIKSTSSSSPSHFSIITLNSLWNSSKQCPKISLLIHAILYSFCRNR